MTVTEAFKKGTETLKLAGNNAPANDAGVLLCFILNCEKSFLYSHGTMEMSDKSEGDYFNLIRERAFGKPLQYLTGRQEFMSLVFEVGQGVLVPRQETEILVEKVIDFCRDFKKDIKILDIGTGSGCIAASLAHYLPSAFVTATDKMPEALVIARRNILRLGVDDRVKLIQSDLFETVENEQFDVIVSNPPYIPSSDIDKLQDEVRRYEPRCALDGGEDGLFFYRAITAKAPEFLRKGGLLAFEAGIGQADKIAGLMAGSFESIEIYKDLAGIDRVVTGRLKAAN